MHNRENIQLLPQKIFREKNNTIKNTNKAIAFELYGNRTITTEQVRQMAKAQLVRHIQNFKNRRKGS